MKNNFKLLRKQIKTKLKHLSPEFRIASAKNIAKKIIRSKVFRSNKNIACYIPIEDEVNIWQVIKNIWIQGKNCYLPAFSPFQKNHLIFVKFLPNDTLLETDHYKTLEPKIDLKKTIAPENLDLVIIPLMGFASERFRLGRGTGCYDRTFAFKNCNPTIKPCLVGIGYKCQQVEFKPRPWDVAMDKIVTE